MKWIYKLTFLIFFLLIFPMQGSAFKLDTYFSGYYFERSNGKGEHYASWRLDYYTIDDVLAYCIEPGAEEGDALEEVEENQLPLSSAKIEKMKLIAYYGYLYPGHESLNYRAATQALLWEVILGEGTKVTYSTERYGNGNVYSVDKEKKEIETLVQHHFDKPSFDGKDFPLVVGETITLQDNNHVLSNFTVHPTAFVEVHQQGNTLTITPKTNGTFSVMLLKRRVYLEKAKFFYGNAVQNMMTAGNVDIVPSVFGVGANYGNLKVKKIDQVYGHAGPGGTLKGAIYGVYTMDGTEVVTIQTNENGEAETGAILPYGKYYLQEIKSSEGYLLDPNKYVFQVQTTSPVSLTVKEEGIQGKVQVEKWGEKMSIKDGILSSNQEKLSSVSFMVYAKENITSLDGKIIYYPKDSYVGTLQTNLEGIGTLSLPFGQYYIVEKEAPLGYLLDPQKYDFTITSEKRIQQFSFTNPWITASLQIQKIDAKTKEGIPGVAIGIYLETGECVYQGLTNEEGFLQLILPYGKYYYQEIQAVEGYQLNLKKHYFEVQSSKQLSYLLENTKIQFEEEKETPLEEVLEPTTQIEIPSTYQQRNLTKEFVALFFFILGIGAFFYQK